MSLVPSVSWGCLSVRPPSTIAAASLSAAAACLSAWSCSCSIVIRSHRRCGCWHAGLPHAALPAIHWRRDRPPAPARHVCPHAGNEELKRPCQLYDPSHVLLNKVFGNEPDFPSGQFATEPWLKVTSLMLFTNHSAAYM